MLFEMRRNTGISCANGDQHTDEDALRYDGYRFDIVDSGIDSRYFRFEMNAFSERKQEFPDRFGPESKKIFKKGAAKRMAQTAQKNIRFTSEQWKRIEKEAEKRNILPNRLVVQLAMEGLKHREWPRTEAEILR